jgi:hypothetical protein
MKQAISIRKRKELGKKLSSVFENDMKSVPVGLRKIMANDLVTAFDSRLCVLNQAQSNLGFLVITDGEVQVETV